MSPARSRITLRLPTSPLVAAAIFAASAFWFASQGDAQTGTSAQSFQQIAAVLQHPRCLNCHTKTTFPKQGNDRHRHTMNVARGADGHGALGLYCAACHGRHNNAYSGVPGADDDWRVAPLSMGWEGLTTSELCRTLKDPAKNGGRNGAQIIEHLSSNLVRWAWEPGANAKGERRDAPPGSYDGFVALMEDWIKSGASCPNS